MSVSSTELDRVLTGALGALWGDCWRSDQPLQERQRMFDRRLDEAVRRATGREPEFSLRQASGPDRVRRDA